VKILRVTSVVVSFFFFVFEGNLWWFHLHVVMAYLNVCLGSPVIIVLELVLATLVL
jgi:hypothetical protein